MPDIAAISSVLSSLKTATEITKLIRESDVSLEKAELKMKLAELMGALADAKIEMTAVQETISDRDQRIAELEDSFEKKASVFRHYDAYYIEGEAGSPLGQPHCLRCWDVDHKLFALHFDHKDRFSKVCPKCSSKYEARLANKYGTDGKTVA
ncbi:hypothetical protein IP80_21135 [beta proteobacterium AAP65]|nr:hypothetical protein IP80_21135 [beta proteobacterium AAP65]